MAFTIFIVQNILILGVCALIIKLHMLGDKVANAKDQLEHDLVLKEQEERVDSLRKLRKSEYEALKESIKAMRTRDGVK